MPSKTESASDQLLARTDGRTYGRTTHLEEITLVPERAGDFECPKSHPHAENCYRQHRCRCRNCRAGNAARQRDYLSRHPGEKRTSYRKCKCGCGTPVSGWWAAGHNRNAIHIHPAGMTLERAVELANGAKPREIVR